MKIILIALMLLNSTFAFADGYNLNVINNRFICEQQNQKMLQSNIVISKSSSSYSRTSKKTGRTKTVPVRSYYKKNGTYVPKHYRSLPRRK